MKKTIISSAVGCLVASVAFAAFDASAATHATTLSVPSVAVFAVTSHATPIMVARRGADDPPGHNAGDDRGRGRGRDDVKARQSQGADDPAGRNVGDDKGRGRGKDDGLNHA